MPENGDTECACSAPDLGQPPGQLLGYRGDVLLATGNHGDDLLTYPLQTLSRRDNGTIFRCVLLSDWAETGEQEVVTALTVRVACESSLKHYYLTVTPLTCLSVSPVPQALHSLLCLLSPVCQSGL